MPKGFRHGFVGTKLYRIWMGMIARCRISSATSYEKYGGRGITVCERWLKFQNFLEDMGVPPTEGHSIDRINNDLGYFPENCRWANIDLQANNRRNNVLITFHGETLTAAQWARKLGIPRTTIIRRLRSGKTAAQILSKNLLPAAFLGKEPPIAAIRRSKTHCKHGHALSGDNLYIKPDGRRACRKCLADRNKAFYERKKNG